MLLWVGHSGGAQVGELSLHIVMYSAVKWAFEMFNFTLRSGTRFSWDWGPERLLVVSPERQPHGGRTFLMASQSFRESAPTDRKWKLTLSWDLGPEAGTAIFPLYSTGQSRPKVCPDSREGAGTPLLNRRYLEAFAAIFNPPQCLAPNQYPVSVYWMVHRFGSVLDPEKWHNGKRYWVKEEFKNEYTDWGHRT